MINDNFFRFTRRRNDNDNNNSGSGSTDFDLIIFSQSWPKAECQAWKQKSPSNECRLPKNTEWTIHGMWPSELHEMGPSSCTNTKFDPSALDSIREELETKWMDVHAGSNPESFWNHEWSKHGTCSLNLESTNTEKKYFQKALELHDRYNIRNVLEEANIVTGEKYPVKSILDAINQSWGVNAQVTCGQNTVNMKLDDHIKCKREKVNE